MDLSVEEETFSNCSLKSDWTLNSDSDGPTADTMKHIILEIIDIATNISNIRNVAIREQLDSALRVIFPGNNPQYN